MPDPNQPLQLPADVALIPALDLSADTRHRIGATHRDVVLTRPGSRLLAQVLDEEAAKLLQEFHHPRPIVDAILRYSAATGRDPRRVLEGSFGLICHLQSAGFLIDAASQATTALAPLLESGARLGGTVVLRCVHLLEDSQVYEAVDSLGKRLALKLCPPSASTAAQALLANEIEILRRVGGRVAPRLVSSGEFDGASCMWMEWCEGVELGHFCAVHQLDATFTLSPRLEICRSVLRAYELLHGCDIVHGDVNLKNLLVAPSGAVRLVDFGFARVDIAENSCLPARRGGVAIFFDPEYVAACVAGRDAPAATRLSDQYSLAAVIYRVLTGCNYLNFQYERCTLLRQILDEAPVLFSNRGLPNAEHIERVVLKALAKRPEERYESVTELRVTFDNAACEGDPITIPAARPAASAGSDLLKKYLPLEGERWLARLPAPNVSVNFGAAGIALALYHAACLEDDPVCLAAASAWIIRAIRDLTSEGALVSKEAGLPTVESASLYHGQAGVHVVHGLIAAGRGDAATLVEATRALIEASNVPCSQLDLAVGLAGALVGHALLLDSMSGLPIEDARLELLGHGDAVHDQIWREINGRSSIPGGDPGWLGIAHGWAGIIYASLLWSVVAGRECPDCVVSRLDQLTRHAQRDGKGVYWPQRLEQGRPRGSAWPGWCHGSSGYVQLYTLADKALADDRFPELAERAAYFAWQNAELSGRSLCCGFAGQAHAFLNLYRRTGNRTWLERAQALEARARRASPVVGEREDSLYKGDLGVILLRAQLGNPEMSSMPAFECPSVEPANQRMRCRRVSAIGRP